MRIKDLHYVMYGEDDGNQTPFGAYDFPDERILKEFFDEAHKEFPEYDYFSFDYETKYGRCGTYTVQWYLVGHKDNNNNGEKGNE